MHVNAADLGVDERRNVSPRFVVGGLDAGGNRQATLGNGREFEDLCGHMSHDPVIRDDVLAVLLDLLGSGQIHLSPHAVAAHESGAGWMG